jgi:hypothetical protein
MFCLFVEPTFFALEVAVSVATLLCSFSGGWIGCSVDSPLSDVYLPLSTCSSMFDVCLVCASLAAH